MQHDSKRHRIRVRDNIPDDPRRIAETIAHEAGHTWGLEHIFDCEDPMTYQLGCGEKYFSATPLLCGTPTNNFFSNWDSRPCTCPSEERSTYNDILASFGPSAIAPPFGQFTTVAEGGRIGPGSPVFVTIINPTNTEDASFFLDGEKIVDVSLPPWAFNIPLRLPMEATLSRFEWLTNMEEWGETVSTFKLTHAAPATAINTAPMTSAASRSNLTIPIAAVAHRAKPACVQGKPVAQTPTSVAPGHVTRPPPNVPRGHELPSERLWVACLAESASGGCCRASGNKTNPLGAILLLMWIFSCRWRWNSRQQLSKNLSASFGDLLWRQVQDKDWPSSLGDRNDFVYQRLFVGAGLVVL